MEIFCPLNSAPRSVMPSIPKAFSLILLLILMLLLLNFGRDGGGERLPRLWRIIQEGLNHFDFPPAP